MNTKWFNTLAGATLAGALLAGTPAFADYNKLLDALQENGTLTAEQAEGLKAQTLIPDNKWLDKMELRGRVHVQAAIVDGENDVASGDWSTIELRRARFGARGDFPGKFRAHIEGNILPGEASLRAAYISWRKHKPATFTVGYDKPRSSLEENTSSASILTVERSHVTNTIAAPGETVGAWLSGDVAPFFYHIGIHNDEDAVRNTAGEKSEYLFNGRAGVELEVGEGSLVLAGTYLASDDPNGNVGGDYEEVTIGSLEFATGPFDFRTEFMMGDMEGMETSGFYIMPAMMLTDKLQVVGRYESLESDDAEGIRATSRYGRRVDFIGADRGDEYSAIYLGLNYYITGNGNKVMLGVEMNELKNTEEGDYETMTVYSAWRSRF